MEENQESKNTKKEKRVKNKSLTFTSKQAFITAIIAIFLSPISLLIASYLNNRFETPRLSIEYIEPEAELDLKISEKNHKIVKLFMTQFRDLLLEFIPYTQDIEECFEKNKFNKHTLKNSLGISQRIREYLKDLNRRLENNKRMIEDWDKGENLIIDPMIIVQDSIHALVYKNKDLALDTIKSAITK